MSNTVVWFVPIGMIRLFTWYTALILAFPFPAIFGITSLSPDFAFFFFSLKCFLIRMKHIKKKKRKKKETHLSIDLWERRLWGEYFAFLYVWKFLYYTHLNDCLAGYRFFLSGNYFPLGISYTVSSSNFQNCCKI